jgi:transposase
MDVGRYLVEAHLREGRSVASLARDHGLNRSWIYKLLARYQREGEAGLAPRSRRPHSSPTAVSDELEERIVEIRKELFDAGHDYGSETIQVHLERERLDVPSVSSIWRGAEATRVHHAPTPEATQVLLPTLRGLLSQRVLAVRHDPLGRRGRRGRGNREFP